MFVFMHIENLKSVIFKAMYISDKCICVCIQNKSLYFIYNNSIPILK